MDPEAGTLQDSRFLCRNSRKELRPNPGCHCPPSSQDNSNCVPARGAKDWGWGCQCLALPSWLPFPVLAEGNRDRRWRCAPGSCSHELI